MKNARLKPTGLSGTFDRDFIVDSHSNIYAIDVKSGGKIKSQSVEALLLLEILKELRLQGKSSPINRWNRIT